MWNARWALKVFLIIKSAKEKTHKQFLSLLTTSGVGGNWVIARNHESGRLENTETNSFTDNTHLSWCVDFQQTQKSYGERQMRTITAKTCLFFCPRVLPQLASSTLLQLGQNVERMEIKNRESIYLLLHMVGVAACRESFMRFELTERNLRVYHLTKWKSLWLLISWGFFSLYNDWSDLQRLL